MNAIVRYPAKVKLFRFFLFFSDSFAYLEENRTNILRRHLHPSIRFFVLDNL